MPTFQDRNVVVRLQGQPDISSEAMSQRATDLGNTIRGIPGISGVGATVGRAVTGDRVVNVNSSDVWVSIAPDADYQTTLAAIKNAAGQVRVRRLTSSPTRPKRCETSGASTPGPTPSPAAAGRAHWSEHSSGRTRLWAGSKILLLKPPKCSR